MCKGGSPGLVVMGRDSRSKGRGFESRHHILDGHFSHIHSCCKNCNSVCLKRPKINEKQAGVGRFLNKIECLTKDKMLNQHNYDSRPFF